MSGTNSPSSFLRQISVKPLGVSLYPLVSPGELVIGRDPRCDVVFDSNQYGEVSRHHAKLCAVSAPHPQSTLCWQVCDLNSANGTYVNGERVEWCRTLEDGDRITLGQNGPEFVFEVHAVSAKPQPSAVPLNTPYPLGMMAGVMAAVGSHSSPSGSGAASSVSDRLTLSQILPILSTGSDLSRKAYLLPMLVTVSFVILLFVTIGTAAFNAVLAAYLAGCTYYFVYQLCGKEKPLWLLVGAACLTAALLASPVLFLFIFVFRSILPGAIPEDLQAVSFPVLFIRMFFGAGLMEELFKALPVFLAYGIGRKLRSPYREQVGVWEPLDGILIGTASAIGFTLMETLGQYVPSMINATTLEAGAESGALLGLQLLIPRVLGSVAGHMAYSGYFGYFIGLSVLRPANRWPILGIGYFSAALLHTLWNAAGVINILALGIVGGLSYAFLAAAILKGRAISPTRSQNFATRFM
jgi:RsiW-degrading membrane proteinase PrsW (M82 family)